MSVTMRGWGRVKGSPLEALGFMEKKSRWVDHAYRERWRDGEWQYVSEPYSLDAAAMYQLAMLDALGWDVTVDGQGVHHSSTLRVILRRKAVSQ